jgi:hypothetical protein
MRPHPADVPRVARGTDSLAEQGIAPPPVAKERLDDALDFKGRVRLMILGGSSVLLVILWSVLLARGLLRALIWMFHLRG